MKTKIYDGSTKVILHAVHLFYTSRKNGCWMWILQLLFRNLRQAFCTSLLLLKKCTNASIFW